MITINEAIHINEVENILFENENIILSENTKSQLKHCFDFLNDFASEKIIYGINTGFGPMAQYRINDESLKELQYNIIRSHSTGAGNPLPNIYVRAAMLARL